MAFSQIADVAPNYRDYGGWWLKAYTPGTTTPAPKVMSDNSTGSPQAAKYQINVDGFIVSSGSALIIPFIDGDYDLYLFPTEAEADANDTSNALRLADDIAAAQSIDNKISYSFSSVANLKAGTTGGEDVTDELKALIDSGDVAASTLGYYGTYSDSESPSGGANYILTTLARARAEKGSLWVPDTYGDHYLFGGTDYIAILNEIIPTFEQFGTDGVSDTAQVKAALSSGLVAGTDGIYIIDAEVLIEDTDINLAESPNSTFKFTTASARFNFKYSYTDVQSVSAVDNTATIDMSDGTAATLTPCTKLTVSDGAAYSAGDVVKIVSDDVITGSDPTDNHKIGEHAVIFSVVANDVYLDRRLRANDGAYTTNVRLAKASTKSCNLGSFKVDGDYNNPAVSTRITTHVRVEGCAKLKTTGKIISKQTQSGFFNPASCHEPSLGDFVCVDGRTDATLGAFAHGILFTNGCNDFIVGSIYGRNLRHLVDTTAFSASNQDDIYIYGGTVGGLVGNVFGIGMQAAPASSHNDSQQITYTNVTSLKPIHGPNGLQSAVGLRGKYHRVDNITIEDGVGLYAFSDHNAQGNSIGHSVGKITMLNRGFNDRARSVYIDGGSSSSVTGIAVGEIVIKNISDDNLSNICRVEYGDLKIGRITCNGGSDTNDIDLFNIQAGGSIEVENMIGRDLGTFSLLNMEDDTSSAVFHNVNIETDETFGYLADLNSTNSYLRFHNVTLNNRGSSSDLIQNKGATADVIADWTLTNSDQTNDRNRKRLPTIVASAATAYDIDFDDRGGDFSFQKVVTNIVGASIGDISDGNYYGQRICISNDFTSPQDISIPDNANGLRLDATITLTPSRSVTALWTGFEWVLAD